MKNSVPPTQNPLLRRSCKAYAPFQIAPGRTESAQARSRVKRAPAEDEVRAGGRRSPTPQPPVVLASPGHFPKERDELLGLFSDGSLAGDSIDKEEMEGEENS